MKIDTLPHNSATLNFQSSLTSLLKSFLVLIAIILSGLIGYIAGVKNTSSVPPQSTTPSTSKNLPTPTSLSEQPWQHYQNQGLGFAIDFPGNWSKPVQDRQQTNTTVKFDHEFSITYGDFYDSRLRKLSTFNELVNSFSVYHTVSDIELAGKYGKKFVSQSSSDEGGVEYLFPGVYLIRYNLVSNTDSALEQTFNKMLESFYFADQNGDVNPIDPETKWHIYISTDYSFRYPGDWIEIQGTGCPTFTTAKRNSYRISVCLYTQGYPYKDSEFLQDKLNILPEGFSEISRKSVIIDSREGVEQTVKVNLSSSTYYNKFYYLQSDVTGSSEETKRIFEITVEGIPVDKKDSAFSLIDQVISTFKLTFPQ